MSNSWDQGLLDSEEATLLRFHLVYPFNKQERP